MWRQALRALARSPGYTATAVTTVALTAAATGTGVTVLYKTVLRPRLANRIVVVLEPHRSTDDRTMRVSGAEFDNWRDRTDTFRDAALSRISTASVRLNGEHRLVPSAYVSETWFDIHGRQPALGHPLRDDRRELVISHDLWDSVFDGRPDVIGGTIEVGDTPYAITGVAARGATTEGTQPDIWQSAESDEYYGDRRARWYSMTVRLPRGETVAQAQAEADIMAATLAADHPDTNAEVGVRLTTLADRSIEPVKDVLVMISGAVLIALLGGAAALANLRILRRSARSGETWTRWALGATPTIRCKDRVAEELPITAAGATGAAILAHWLAVASAARWPQNLSPGGHGDGAIESTAFATLCALGVTCLSGVAAARSDRRPWGLTTGPRPARTTTARELASRIACALQVSVAVVILHAAATVYAGLQAVRTIDLGTSNPGVLATFVDLRSKRDTTDAEKARFTQRIIDETALIPGVEAAAASLGIPGGAVYGRTQLKHPHPSTGIEETHVLDVVAISPGYLKMLGIPLRAGRPFGPDDNLSNEYVTIASESAARLLYGAEDGVGRTIPAFKRRLVGITGDVRYEGIEVPAPTLYLPLAQMPGAAVHVLTDGIGDFIPGARSVAEHIRRVDPSLPIGESTIIGEPTAAATAVPAARVWTLGAVTVLILLQTAVVLYGGVAYSATGRTGEYALRMALGAQRGDVAWSAVKTSAVDSTIGVAVGTAAALSCHEWIAGMTDAPSSAADLSVYAMGAAAIAAVSLAAMCQPALKAMHTDPAAVLTTAEGK